MLLYPSLYESGNLRIFGETSEVDAAAYSPEDDIIYGLQLNARPHTNPTVIISGDNGASWVKEDFNFYYNSIMPHLRSKMAAAGGSLFLIGYGEINGEDFDLIIKRTGPPGEGVYSLSYLSFMGPYFIDLFDFDFRNKSDGMAVGANASLVYKGNAWTQEDAGSLDLWGVAGDPGGGYWGISQTDLLRHR